MTEELITRLFIEKNLGAVVPPITSVSGGFMHRMYKVDTEKESFAVKHLNPEIMKRPEAMGNLKRADALESVLEDAGVPIVPAIIIDGEKMQSTGGEYFYIFHWQDGEITDWNNISAHQCEIAGRIQGMIHAIESKQIQKTEPELSSIDWSGLIGEAVENTPEMGRLLSENKELLLYAEAEMNKARAELPGIECIIDEDMDPKNVMWYEGEPYVIDLECLEYGNPVSSALQLSLQWAGITTCDLDIEKMKAFFRGYLEEYDNGFRDYPAVFGLAYTWVEWLEYNIRRALGECSDEAEQEMGRTQVEMTIDRIKYLRENEVKIKQNLIY